MDHNIMTLKCPSNIASHTHNMIREIAFLTSTEFLSIAVAREEGQEQG